MRWALSDRMREIAERVISAPQDIRTAIAFETQVHQGQIPGVIDARATLTEQELASDPTLFVVSDPGVFPLTLRNQVLAWTLREAESLTLAAIRRHRLGAEQEWIHSRAALFERAARTRLLREVMLSPSGRRRPGGAAIRDAKKSMSPLYQQAMEAMELFERVERMKKRRFANCWLPRSSQSLKIGKS
ncbi:hypothetical protein BRCH_02137 [Candidatus Burkholderia brachyanthoides]|nr:hypothetical protein BRCH_02137 [Candidatus Burkholderia brachyanthoides]